MDGSTRPQVNSPPAHNEQIITGKVEKLHQTLELRIPLGIPNSNRVCFVYIGFRFHMAGLNILSHHYARLLRLDVFVLE